MANPPEPCASNSTVDQTCEQEIKDCKPISQQPNANAPLWLCSDQLSLVRCLLLLEIKGVFTEDYLLRLERLVEAVPAHFDEVWAKRPPLNVGFCTSRNSPLRRKLSRMHRRWTFQSGTQEIGQSFRKR